MSSKQIKEDVPNNEIIILNLDNRCKAVKTLYNFKALDLSGIYDNLSPINMNFYDIDEEIFYFYERK